MRNLSIALGTLFIAFHCALYNPALACTNLIVGKNASTDGSFTKTWRYEGDGIRYELETPVPVTVRLDHTQRQLEAGSYTFWTAKK